MTHLEMGIGCWLVLISFRQTSINVFFRYNDMRFATTLIGILLLLGCAPSSERKRMEQVIERANRQNLAYDSITHIDSLRLAASYFDRHGSHNEQMQAYYLLASAYRDAGEAPLALESFHDAAERGDTTSADCDYALLSRVHAHTAALLKNMQLPYDALEEFDIAQKCAEIGGDVQMALVCYSSKAGAYSLIDANDSVKTISGRASQLLLAQGDTLYSLVCLKIAINAYIDDNELQKAKDAMARYERIASLDAPKSVVEASMKHYNYLKGKYYLGTGQLDSARIFFERIITLSDPQDELQRLRGLAMYYAKVGVSDSAFKYSELYVATDDSIYNKTVRDNFQKMHSLYNYERNRRMAEQKERELSELWLKIVLGIVAISIVIILMFLSFRKIRRDMIHKLDSLNTRYGESLSKYAMAKKRLAQMERRQIADAKELQQLESELDAIKQELGNFQEDKQQPDEWGLDDDIFNSDVLRRIRKKTAKARQPSDSELQEVKMLVEAKFPKFIPTLKQLYPQIKNNNIYFCIFLKLRFITSELQVIFNMTPQSVTNRRSFLHQKMFGEKGGSKEFDAKIQDLGNGV